MTTEQIKKLPAEAICEFCNGEGKRESAIDADMDSITVEVECVDCNGTGIDPYYKPDHLTGFNNFLNDLTR